MQPDDLVAAVRGEIEKDEGVLVIKRIGVRFRLRAPADARDTVQRVKEVYAKACPVARSIGGCVEIRTEVELIT